MALVAVAIPVDDPQEIGPALEEARRAIASGARLVEWRVDALVDPLLPERCADALMMVRRLVADAGAPSIVTVRAAAEGGAFRGDDADRISFLEALGTGDPAPRYLDLELASFDRSANLRQKIRLAVQHDRQARDLRTSLILSTHDFTARPADLMSRYARMVDEPACAVAKLAWRARSLRDCLEAFELLRERRRPTIALCMGEFGLMSRVLAPKFGGMITFARGERSAETAAGQPSVGELFGRWRFARIGPRTSVYGVIGWPVRHSRSPDLHNAGFDAIGLDAIHLPLPVEGSWESFKATIGAMLAFTPLDFMGASVTAPHKEHLVRFVRECSGGLCPLSARSGSANTLIVRSERREGRSEAPTTGPTGGRMDECMMEPAGRSMPIECVNTDGPAAVAALGSRVALSGRRVAVLGAGGAARAIAWALVDAGARVLVFNRTPERAAALVAAINDSAARGGGVSAACAGASEALGHPVLGRAEAAGTPEDAPDRAAEIDAVINCTSVGMTGGGAEGRSPLSDRFRFRSDQVVMETVYAPRLTPLLARARDAGATVIDGTEMFIRQAEAQFHLWTGRGAPPGLFRQVLERSEVEP